MKFKLVIVIYFRLEDTIEFRNINNLSEVVLDLKLERCKLWCVCASLPATLFYDDQARRRSTVRAVDCSVIPPEVARNVSVINFKKNITGMSVFQNSERHLLMATDGIKIWAHEVATGSKQWEINFPFPVILNIGNMTRITNEGDFLFCDGYSMGTYRFTAKGEYSSFTPMDDPKELKGLWTIRWNDEAKSLLAIVQRAHNWHIATFTR